MQDTPAEPAISNAKIVNTPEEQEDIFRRTRKVLKRFNKKRENLVPILQQVQD